MSKSTIEKHSLENNPPKAKSIPHKLRIHDHERMDEFYWLNQAENPEVIAYLKAENEYTKAVMKDTEELQKSLFDEIIGRIPQRDQSAPYFKNGYYYYVRFEEGQEYPIYCRKKQLESDDEIVLLDANQLASGHSYYQIGGLSVSPDNRYLAFGEDTVSRRQYKIRVKDLTTGQFLKTNIPDTTGSVAWANDNLTFFYMGKDAQLRPSKVLKHKIHSPNSPDELIYEELDDTFTCYAFRSKSGQYIMIGSFQTITTEYRLLNADKPDGEWELFCERQRGHEYYIDHFEDQFYIRTNADATNFKIMVCPKDQTSQKHWKEWLPHNDDVLITGLDLFKSYIAVSQRRNGLPVIEIFPDNDPPYMVPFKEGAYTAFSSQNNELNTHKLRLYYSSLTTPTSALDFDMKTREFSLIKSEKVEGDFNKVHYTTKRLSATAHDGTTVPISIVYKNGTLLDGTAPLLLYGYGSYGINVDPSFSSPRLSLLDRGFIFAIAHIRGGEELGRKWYDGGKLLSKKNTFLDFISCAEFLLAQKYTNPNRLFALGGSAGGLLMGAVVNMRPELWKGIIAAVPFVDVVTTMTDKSIPLTTGEYDEWGNPNERPFYEYMLSYSPYDQVTEQAYPAMLVTTGLHDSQVQYWEPAKWVAKLRKHNTGDHAILLHTNMETGHSGSAGRFERHKETAMEYAFLIDLSRG